MIRSILVALDDTSSSQIARRFAIKMAKHRKAKLAGLGIVDRPWLTAPEAVPIGGAAFKAELDQQLVEEARAHIRKIEREFKKESQDSKIETRIIDTAGEPIHEISRYLVDHDILIVGKDADFHFSGNSETSNVVNSLLSVNPRPAILTCTTETSGKDIIVAYDGSLSASKTIYLSILLDMYKSKNVHLVTVASSKKEAKDRMKLAANLFENHGIEITIHPVESSERPSREIIKLAGSLDTSMIVMGACGHRGIQYLLTGSCSQELLKETGYPYFIYH